MLRVHKKIQTHILTTEQKCQLKYNEKSQSLDFEFGLINKFIVTFIFNYLLALVINEI